jgi:hypothetical protein
MEAMVFPRLVFGMEGSLVSKKAARIIRAERMALKEF